MLNINGPGTDPCGTPWSSSVQELNNVLILVLCQRFDKKLNNSIKDSLPNR